MINRFAVFRVSAIGLRWTRCFSVERPPSISDILKDVQKGKLEPMNAERMIQDAVSSSESPEETLKSFANLDHSRSLRTGFPEAVFASGKTPFQVATILDDMAKHVNQRLEQGEISDSQRAILATR